MFSILRKTVVFFAAFIGIASSNYSLAAEEPSDVVVVGVIAQMSDDPNAGIKVNAFYGINLEYLTNIAKVLNLKLILRSYHNIPDILNDIESGKIDGAVGFSKTPEREERFIFSEPFSLALLRFGIVKTVITNVTLENCNGYAW